MTQSREALLTELGFRFGQNGTHAARTMMLDDLRLLLGEAPADAGRDAYSSAVIDRNVLGKPTKKSRELAFRHLVALYSLDSNLAVFRALRRLWAGNPAAQPGIALATALARDPMLRRTRPLVLDLQSGAPLPRPLMEAHIEGKFPGRFSSASLKSFAQNVGGTWTDAGFLHGRSRKTRSSPIVQPEWVAFLLFLGFLEGRSGQRLFSSDWMALTGLSDAENEALAVAASHRGLIVFMNAGGVKEVRFPGYLTPNEERIRQELHDVL